MKTSRGRATGLTVLAIAGLVLPPLSRAGSDLVGLGSGTFSVDPASVSAPYAQTDDSLVFSGSYILGDTVGGFFTEADWSSYATFGLRMTLAGSNPDLSFSVIFYDAGLNEISSYQGTTAGLGLNPTVVPLTFSLAGTGNFASVVGMLFTWDGFGSVNAAIGEVVGFPATPTEGFFAVRAPGGAVFYTGTGNTGVRLVAGGNSWSILSDSNAKTHVTAVDHRAVLRKLALLPVSSWVYKHAPGRRYVGPMAQDFHAAFGLGSDDKHMATQDTDGVALAALKGLALEWHERKERIAAQGSRLAELESELRTLRELIHRTATTVP